MYLISLTVIFSVIISHLLFGSNRINHEIAQEFVLETKQIHIPGYFGAFNPSILRWNDRFLMSFRVRNHRLVSTFEIGLVFLDQYFNPISEPQILDIRSFDLNHPKKEQDPRLLYIGEQLYLVYSNEIKERAKIGKYETRRVFVTRLHFEDNCFTADQPECLIAFDGERVSRWEKNWVPFDYEGQLLLSYSIAPHLIFRPLLGTGSCETVANTTSGIKWSWGHLRGGTPALKISENQYLAFFHSSTSMATVHSGGETMLHYFMGAYIFNASPPYSITHISPEPIIGKGFYTGPSYRTFKPLRVVFPGGYLMDDSHIWVFYGRQDHEIWAVKIEKQGLIDSLVSVNTLD